MKEDIWIITVETEMKVRVPLEWSEEQIKELILNSLEGELEGNEKVVSLKPKI